MAAQTQIIDPWLDGDYRLADHNNVHFQDITQIAEENGFVEPEVPDNPAEPIAPVEPVVAVAPDVPPPDPTPVAVLPLEPEPEPSVQHFKDGSTLTVEKKKGQWRAELDTNIAGVKPEVFYGKTKDELYTRIAEGKVNATRKIRELDRKVKLGGDSQIAPPQRVNAPKKIQPRALTADEIFHYKTLNESDPVAALDYYNEKRYGLTPDEFAQRLNQPVITQQLNQLESVARTFVQTNPDYYQTDKNLGTIVRYLVRQYLNRTIQPDEDFDQLTIDLLERGIWTPEHLEQAKEELLAGGFLEVAPKPPTPRQEAPPPTPEPPPQPAVPATPVAVAPPAPAAPAADSQPPAPRTRAGNFGIRVTGNSRSTNPEPPPPDEDVNNWSDDVVEAAMKQYRLNRAKQR